MQVILLEKVKNLGDLGEQVTVRPGYGRNYLVPQGIAVSATAENIEHFESRRAELEKAAADKLSAAESKLASIEALEQVTITASAGDEGKLFGSVGPRDIAEAITQAGVELSKAEVAMPEGPIRTVGNEHQVDVILHSDVRKTINIAVVAE